MKNKDTDGCSRRQFLKTAGAVGLGAAVAPSFIANAAREGNKTGMSEDLKVPIRPFGKTGRQVSTLSLGGMFDIPRNQIILKLALKWGITYWDTAHSYGNGASETGIGKYLQKMPEDRKKIFLVTKSAARDPEKIADQLDKSLARLNTDYVDLFFIHSVRDIREMNTDIRRLGDALKKQGKIRLFGFSTHRNMEMLLMDASKLDWIDGIMMTYNFRLMHHPAMKEAVQACSEAGIGLTAMKTQGGGSVSTDSETAVHMAGRFLQQGYTDAQAKLKAVWENPLIASICSQMPNSSILMANIAAAMDKNSLAAHDKDLLHAYAAETASSYCAGCADICENACGGIVPISNVMRYMMYLTSYDDPSRARESYRRLPREVRKRIPNIDYSKAERRCPQGLAIGRLMQEAARTLA